MFLSTNFGNEGETYEVNYFTCQATEAVHNFFFSENKLFKEIYP